MNWTSAMLWGFVATVFQTTLEAGGRGVGLTRISLPFMIGTMVTADRDRASLVGLGVHFIDGWALALLYAALIESAPAPGWLVGPLAGLVHGVFLLAVVLPALPFLHPRMVSDTHGPEPTPMLEPPGFMALNYGRMTSVVTILAHVAYGTVLGIGYQPAG